VNTIREHIVDIKDDGSIQLALDHFGYIDGLVMTNAKFASRFGGPARKPDDRITKREMDLARSIQDVTTEIVLRIAKYIRKETGMKQLTMAGGVSLNCVANGVLQRSRIFDELWIQPAAGDAGGAIGAALAAYHQGLSKPRNITPGVDGMNGGYLGPEWHADDIRAYLEREQLVFETHEDEGEWAARLASLLASENVVGLFQGRMEVGPRALGHRSIVADARSPKMQSVMNLKIKQRESFRPFAPAVLASHAHEYFDLDAPSPYMLLVAPVREEKRVKDARAPAKGDDLLSEVNRVRSVVPAITHVDDSARVQTVEESTSPRFFALLSAFEKETGCPMLINTSFNVRGEPIVCTPEDAYACFMSTEMDYLSLGPFILARKAQPHWEDKARWMRRFAAD